MQNSKILKLRNILNRMGSVLVAYSGGLDSTFLLKVAQDTLGNNVLAVTADSQTYPKQELVAAKRTAKQLGARHLVIKTKELSNRNFSSNPLNRCYFCKKELFTRLKAIARKNKLNFVIDATNLSDKLDFRPGNLAKKELGVRSPLQEAGFSKADIRSLSKKLGLSTWDKPSLACLASRIPYGVRIKADLLARINRAENHLKNLGFRQVRVRHYNGLCRIEVPKQDLPRLLKSGQQLVDKFKKLGYNYITVDLEGYRSGSLNEVIKK